MCEMRWGYWIIRSYCCCINILLWLLLFAFFHFAFQSGNLVLNALEFLMEGALRRNYHCLLCCVRWWVCLCVFVVYPWRAWIDKRTIGLAYEMVVIFSVWSWCSLVLRFKIMNCECLISWIAFWDVICWNWLMV